MTRYVYQSSFNICLVNVSKNFLSILIELFGNSSLALEGLIASFRRYSQENAYIFQADELQTVPFIDQMLSFEILLHHRIQYFSSVISVSL